MTLRNGVTLYTSLPPTLRRSSQGRDIGEAYQAKCLQSWKDAGFALVSVNTEAEIAALRPCHPDIDFLPGTDGRPRIVELIRHIAASGHAISGIVNADIVFLKGEEVAADVIACAHDGVVMIERINVSPDTMRPTLVSCCGFDAFIFDTRRLTTLAMDRDLRIGDTWWDYCFPLAIHSNGGQLRRSRAPLLLHLDHPQGWDSAQYLANGRKSYAAFAELVDGTKASSQIGKTLDAATIGEFSHATFAWLKATAADIDFTRSAAAAA